MEQEYRVKKLAGILQELKIDLAILLNPANIRFFTDFRMNPATESILVITDEGEITYVVPILDYNRALKTCWIKNIVPFPEDNPNFLMPLKNLLKNRIISKIGIEADSITLHEVSFIKELFNVEMEAIDDQLIDMRAIKTDAEINLIRKSANIADTAMQECLKILHEGITEAEISSYAKYIFEREGGEGTSFEPFVMSGENGWLPQRFSSTKKIAKGELILFDMGTVYKGYCSDLTRTFSLGGLNKKQEEIFNIAYAAQQEAIKAIKPGMYAKDIDKVARDYITDKGYGKYFPHITGHGLGISDHEKPILDKDVQFKLEANMVVTVEPGIYLENVGAARVEDMVLVTREGHELLTHTKRELI